MGKEYDTFLKMRMAIIKIDFFLGISIEQNWGKLQDNSDIPRKNFPTLVLLNSGIGSLPRKLN